MQGANILRYRDHSFENGIPDLGLPNEVITSMSSSGDGGVLLSTIGQQVFEYRQGSLQKAGLLHVPNSTILSSARTTDGSLWLGTSDNGLFSFAHQGAAPVRPGGVPKKINVLLAGPRGTLWVGTDDGLYSVDALRANLVKRVDALAHQQVLTLVSDQDENLWVGTARGLVCVHEGRATASQTSPREIDATPAAIFRDREGDLWIGGSHNLQRWRDDVFAKYADTDSASGGGAVFAAAGQRLWFAPATGGLQWFAGDRHGRIKLPGPSGDVVYSISGKGTDLWLCRKQGGLVHLSRGRAPVVYSVKDGLAQNSVFTVLETEGGTVWAGTLSGGLSRLLDGAFQTFTPADGLASSHISALEEDGAHRLWVATPEGVSMYASGQWRTFRKEDDCPQTRLMRCSERTAGPVTCGWAQAAELP